MDNKKTIKFGIGLTYYPNKKLMRIRKEGFLLVALLTKTQHKKLMLENITPRLKIEQILTNSEIKRYRKDTPIRLLSGKASGRIKTYYNGVLTTNKNKRYYQEIDTLNKAGITNISREQEQKVNTILIQNMLNHL